MSWSNSAPYYFNRGSHQNFLEQSLLKLGTSAKISNKFSYLQIPPSSSYVSKGRIMLGWNPYDYDKLVSLKYNGMSSRIIFAGRTRSGKSVIMGLVIQQMVSRFGYKALLIDPKGDTMNYYQPLDSPMLVKRLKKSGLKPTKFKVKYYTPAYLNDPKPFGEQFSIGLTNLKRMFDTNRSLFRKIFIMLLESGGTPLSKEGPDMRVLEELFNLREFPLTAEELKTFIIEERNRQKRRSGTKQVSFLLVDRIRRKFESGILGENNAVNWAHAIKNNDIVVIKTTAVMDDRDNPLIPIISTVLYEAYMDRQLYVTGRNTNDKNAMGVIDKPLAIGCDESHLYAGGGQYTSGSREVLTNIAKVAGSCGISLFLATQDVTDIHKSIRNQVDYWIGSRPNYADLQILAKRLGKSTLYVQDKFLNMYWNKAEAVKEHYCIDSSGFPVFFFPYPTLSNMVHEVGL